MLETAHESNEAIGRNRTCFSGLISPHRPPRLQPRLQGGRGAGLLPSSGSSGTGCLRRPRSYSRTVRSELGLGRDAVGRRRAASRRSFPSLPPPRCPQGLLKRGRPPVVPAVALGEPRAQLRLPCARCGLNHKFSRARPSRSRSSAGGAGAGIRDPREEQGRGSIKGRRGRKTDERKQLLNATQQVVAHICRDSVRATRLRPPSSALCSFWEVSPGILPVHPHPPRYGRRHIKCYALSFLVLPNSHKQQELLPQVLGTKERTALGKFNSLRAVLQLVVEGGVGEGSVPTAPSPSAPPDYSPITLSAPVEGLSGWERRKYQRGDKVAVPHPGPLAWGAERPFRARG
ncbi:LOW QUALITY PROTEIN: uncharacterized protein AAES06_000600 [Glossophaga mutica]